MRAKQRRSARGSVNTKHSLGCVWIETQSVFAVTTLREGEKETERPGNSLLAERRRGCEEEGSSGGQKSPRLPPLIDLCFAGP